MTGQVTEKRKRALRIRYQLGLRGIEPADISRELGHGRSGFCSEVISGRESSNRTRQRIAEYLGMTYEEVWGEAPRRRGRPQRKEQKQENQG